MNRLRQIHLYLGCLFAPLLAFFAISGLWQTYRLNYQYRSGDTSPRVQQMLALLSTVHGGHQLKGPKPDTLSSPALKLFVSTMALSLLLTMVLGVVMAFRFGHARAAAACLAAGVAIPLGLIALVLF